jgi:UDP-glucuronate 4-epimerase
MKVLVTGGAGFIGSHAVQALAARGDCVRVLDCFDEFYAPPLKRSNYAAAAAAGEVSLIEGDIRDRALLDRAFSWEPEVVVHLAARAGVRPSIENPVLYAQVNVEGTTALLEASRRARIRTFVFASSSSVYGARSNPPFREDDLVNRPISPYAATKIAGEHLCATFSHLYGMQTVALRFFTVYGPRQRPDLAIAKFTRLLRLGQSIPFFGDGQTARDYTFAEDIVRGILAAADRTWPAFDVINLGGSRPVTLANLVSALERASGKRAVLDHRPDQQGDVPLTCADVSKAKAVLGWEARVPLAEGLSRYVAWLDGPEATHWR